MNDSSEKLNIVPEKIIHILLKHLMYLKNENLFLKNNAAIGSFENGFPEKSIGVKVSENGFPEKSIGVKVSEKGIPENNIGVKQYEKGIPENNIGAKQYEKGIPENNIGVKQFDGGIPENNIGVKQFEKGIPENNIGVKQFDGGIPENNIGAKQFDGGIPENNIGVKQFEKGIPENNIGVKQFEKGILENNTGEITNIRMYPIFEEALLEALEQCIKNGAGQYSLHTFYTDFVEAVAKKNSDAATLKEAIANLPLQDTHILAAQLPVDRDSLRKLANALRKHLPKNVNKWELPEKIATELLNLHNAGKATGRQLLAFYELYNSNSLKHLTNLKKYGFIKKQPPRTYVLSELSTQLLLKTFGIPKNEQ